MTVEETVQWALENLENEGGLTEEWKYATIDEWLEQIPAESSRKDDFEEFLL